MKLKVFSIFVGLGMAFGVGAVVTGCLHPSGARASAASPSAPAAGTPLAVSPSASSTKGGGAAIDAVAAASKAKGVLSKELFTAFEHSRYRLQVGDVVEVYVLGSPDTLAKDVPIALDGKLYYMFGNGIPAAGRVPSEVAHDIEAGIGTLFNNAQVSIIPKSFSGNRIMVFGKVRYPNLYPLDSSLTVRQAIARAGGLAQGSYRGTTVEIASLRDSYLRRGDQLIPVNFERLITLNDPTQDVFVRPGDIIYIGSGLGKNSEVYLLGHVKEQKTAAYTDGMTLVGLISGGSELGGGYLPESDLNRLIILRGPLDHPDVIEANLKDILTGKARDVLLTPGDIVYVPEKPYQYLRDVVKSALMTFARSMGTNAGGSTADQVIPVTTDTSGN
jgi:protein involved in polysaccharide export with SLBB domain